MSLLAVAAIATAPAASANDRTQASFDRDGDGRADASVVVDVAGQWEWWFFGSTTGPQHVAWGYSSVTVPLAGDYDGDGRVDAAVFERDNSTLSVLGTTSGPSFVKFPVGPSDTLLPPVDFDADGKTDIGSYYVNPSTQLGTWRVRPSTVGHTGDVVFGAATDTPVPADYWGDGSADIAVARLVSDGAPRRTIHWFIRTADGSSSIDVPWGYEGARAVLGDYDGDGVADVAIADCAGGVWSWYVRGSTGSNYHVDWGYCSSSPRDELVPADYDGDGKTDLATWHSSNGSPSTYYIRSSRDGSMLTRDWGYADDEPLSSALVID